MILKNTTNKIFIGTIRRLASFLLVSSIVVSLIINSAQAEQQIVAPGVSVSVSPENISVNLGSGATSVSISGNVTTIAIGAPAAPPINAAAPIVTKKEHEGWSSWLSWLSFSELIKAGALFGGIGTIITVGLYTLYQNRSHPFVSKITTMFIETISTIKQLWR